MAVAPKIITPDQFGVIAKLAYDSDSPEIREATEAAIDRLAYLGREVERLKLKLDLASGGNDEHF